MTITVRTGPALRQFIPQENTQLTLAEGAAVADALAALAAPPDELGLTVVNGRAAPRDRTLREGDSLEVLPLIIGG